MLIGVIEDVESEYDIYLPSRTNYIAQLEGGHPQEFSDFEETW